MNKEDKHSQHWIDLFKSAKTKAEEEERDLRAHSERYALQLAREAELEDIRRASAQKAEDAEERLRAMRDAFEKEKRVAALSQFIEQEHKIDSLNDMEDMILTEVPAMIEERDEQIEELQDCVTELAETVEVLIEAVRAIAAPKVRKAIRDDKGDIVETIETPYLSG
jgi:hypothetical protein